MQQEIKDDIHCANTEPQRVITLGGVCGIFSFVFYLLSVSMVVSSPSQFEIAVVFLLASTWPILGIVNSYALYRLIALERQGLANKLSFGLSVIGLTIVTAMICVQLTVQTGLSAFQAKGSPQTDWVLLLQVMRLVDLGLDIAWDMFFGWALIVGAFPMYRHSRLGPIWAIPSLMLGAILVILNAATFPWPPASRGLFDIGPVVGLYSLLLSIWLILVGLRMKTVQIQDQSRPEMTL